MVKQVNSGAVKLSPANIATGLPRQMSPEWIDNVIARMLKETNPINVRNLADLLTLNKNKITKVVTGIDKTNNEILVFTIF